MVDYSSWSDEDLEKEARKYGLINDESSSIDYSSWSDEDLEKEARKYGLINDEPSPNTRAASFNKSELRDSSTLEGIGDAVRVLGEGYLNTIISGYKGLFQLTPFGGGLDAADEAIRKTQEESYKPQTKKGHAILKRLNESLLGLIGELGEQASDKLGDAAYDNTGNSPLAGALGKTALPAILEITGLGIVSKATKTGQVIGMDKDLSEVIKENDIDLNELSNKELKQLETYSDDILKKKLSTQDPKKVKILGDALKETQKAREDMLKEAGISQPLPAQISQDVNEFQYQQEKFKQSGKIRDVLDQQELELQKSFDNKINQTKGKSQDAGDSVVNFINAKAESLDERISQLYKTADQFGKDKATIELKEFLKELKKAKGSDSFTKGASRTIYNDLRNKEIIDHKGNIYKNINAKTSEEIRIHMNKMMRSSDSYTRGVISNLKEALDKDSLGGKGNELYQEARKAKSKFEKERMKDKRNKFDENERSIINDILKNKENVSSEKVISKITSSTGYGSKDLQHLKDYLTKGDENFRKQGTEIWDDVRANVLETIKDKSFIGNKEGDLNFSLNQFKKIKDSIGPNRMKILFTKDELKFLDLMEKVGNIRQPKKGTVLGKGPSAQALQALEHLSLAGRITGNVGRRLKNMIDDITDKGIRYKIESRTKDAKFERKTTKKSLKKATSATVPGYMLMDDDDEK